MSIGDRSSGAKGLSVSERSESLRTSVGLFTATGPGFSVQEKKMDASSKSRRKFMPENKSFHL
jgi:hypothetical protein